jgi:hypothetical protein
MFQFKQVEYLVFEGPVRSGLLALGAMDQDRNTLTAV